MLMYGIWDIWIRNGGYICGLFLGRHAQAFAHASR